MQLLHIFDRMYNIIQKNGINLRKLSPEEKKKLPLLFDDEKNMGEYVRISIHLYIIQIFFGNA